MSGYSCEESILQGTFIMAVLWYGIFVWVVRLPYFCCLTLNEILCVGDVVAGDTLSRSLSASSSLRGQPSFPSTPSSSSSRPGNTSSYGNRQRTSPLNSGLWITIELTITVSQIVASIIVLSLSRDEKPQAPLSVWVVGYAAGCLATLPLLYWRYTHRYVRLREQDPLALPPTSPPNPSGAAGPTSYGSLTPVSQDEESQVERQRGLDGEDSGSEDR